MSPPRPDEAQTGAARVRRSLAPREHGAYSQLLFPLVGALVLAAPTAGAALLAAAAVAVFFAHEPVLVLLGHRGRRALDENGARARRRVAALGAFAAACGGLGLVLSPPATRSVALVPLGLAGALAPLLRARREKTLPAEVLAVAALVSASLPVAFAAGVAAPTAFAAAFAWTLSFTVGTAAVHVIIARSSGGRRAAGRMALALVAVGAVGLCAAFASVFRDVPRALPASVLPVAALGLAMAARPVDPRRLRALGWALAISAALTFAIMTAIMRGALDGTP